MSKKSRHRPSPTTTSVLRCITTCLLYLCGYNCASIFMLTTTTTTSVHAAFSTCLCHSRGPFLANRVWERTTSANANTNKSMGRYSHNPLFDVENLARDDDDGKKSVPFTIAEESIDAEYEPHGDTHQQHSNSIQNNSNEGESMTAYLRDDDSILTEREDRLYTDQSGTSLVQESCILVGVEDLSAARRSLYNKNTNHAEGGGGLVYFSLEESMTEMRELIKTAGMRLVGEITQRLNEPNPKTYIGTGKVKETEELASQHNCNTIVFDAELTPGQQKALENAFNKDVLQNDFLVSEREIKVLDRTALILDIFAQHAKTREGKLQVDLALHEYRKPRLTKMWTHLERQSGAGGVGLRGPGESQLEIDKRLLRDRIIVLKKKINEVQKQRGLHRGGRRAELGLPTLALVGYTNAGKSSLLNALTRAGIMAEDILFATLDPTTRKVQLPGLKTHPEVLLTDTVGFIQKLPTQLVAAFRATLEEVREADVLVHVVDVSHPVWEKQEAAVQKVLAEIGATDKPVVTVLNKIDLLQEEGAAERLKDVVAAANAAAAAKREVVSVYRKHTVAISALTGDGMEDFVATVEEALCELLVPIEAVIPYSMGKELNALHEVGNVDTTDFRPEGTYVSAKVPVAMANRLRPYYVNELAGKNGEGLDEQQDLNGAEKVEEEEEIDWVAIGRGRHSTRDKK